MAEHTPGPWWATLRWSGYDGWASAEVISPGNVWICTPIVYGDDASLPEDPNTHPNIALITAAPDLLEALEMVRDADDDEPHIPSVARSFIDYVIAKAKGEKA